MSKRKAFSILQRYQCGEEYGDEAVKHVANVVHLRPQLLNDLSKGVVQRVVVDACEVVRHVDLYLRTGQLALYQRLNVLLTLQLVLVTFGEGVAVDFVDEDFEVEFGDVLGQSRRTLSRVTTASLKDAQALS